MCLRHIGLFLIGLACASSFAGNGIWTSNGPSGGAIYSLAAHPTIATTLYANTRGGIYKTTNGGVTWVKSNNGLNGAEPTNWQLLLDRDNPNRLYVFTQDNRLFRSDDAGANWSATGLELTTPVHGIGMAEVPGDDTTLLINVEVFSEDEPTRPYLLRSTDAGANVVPVIGIPLGRSISSVVASRHPGEAGIVYAGVNGYTMPLPGDPAEAAVYRSVDGGASFVPVLNFGGSGTTVGVYGLTLGPGRVMADSPIGLHYSDDTGQSWTIAYSAAAPMNLSGWMKIADAADVAVVWTFSEGGDPPEEFPGLRRCTIVPPNPGPGATISCELRNNGLTPNASYTHAANSAPIPASPATLVFDAAYPAPLSRLWIGSSGAGVFYSNNQGQTWNAQNNRLQASLVRSLAVHPNPSTYDVGSGLGQYLLAGFGDLAGSSPGLYYSIDGGQNWPTANSGLLAGHIRAIAIDPTTAGILPGEELATVIYAVGRDYPFTVGYRNGGVFKSVDNGQNWSLISNGLPTQSGIADGGPPQVMHTFASIGTIRGLTLDPRSCLVPPLSGPCRFGFAGESPLRTIYITATGAGGAFRIAKSVDAGANWAALDAGLPANQSNAGGYFQLIPMQVRVDPANSNRLYLTSLCIVDGSSPPDLPCGFFRSEDGGQTWVAKTQGLPRQPGLSNVAFSTGAMAMDPSNGDRLWLATDHTSNGVTSMATIYRSVDGGETWTESGDGLAGQRLILALAIDPSAPSVLYAAVTGNSANPGSVFRIDYDDPVPQWRSISVGLIADAAAALAIDPFNPTVLHAGTNNGVWSIRQVPDQDGDGAPDATENLAPPGGPGAAVGDGNNDQMPDAGQRDVGSTGVVIRAPSGGSSPFTISIGSSSAAGGAGPCVQNVDVAGKLALTFGRDYVPGQGFRFFEYPNELLQFEVVDCAAAQMNIRYHNEDFLRYGWTFRYYGPSLPGVSTSIAWHDFSSRATRIDAKTWRLNLTANQFGSYRPSADAILFVGGPACFDDRLLVAGFEAGEVARPNSCEN